MPILNLSCHFPTIENSGKKCLKRSLHPRSVKLNPFVYSALERKDYVLCKSDVIIFKKKKTFAPDPCLGSPTDNKVPEILELKKGEDLNPNLVLAYLRIRNAL